MCILTVLAKTCGQLEEEIEVWWKDGPELNTVFNPKTTLFTVDFRRTCMYDS